MKRLGVLGRRGVFALGVLLWLVAGHSAWADASPPLEGFVSVNGARLQYLDWGGRGPALILVHGLGDYPQSFSELAPAFTDHFHVIAYARRGFGGSEGAGPYDVGTLTEDLRGLMDALGIARADLVGVSAGGGEVTEMAAKHPDRVMRVVYLDAAYNWTSPDFHDAVEALPGTVFARPASAMASFDAYRSYERATWYPDLSDMSRIESYLRERIVIQQDGRVKDRTSPELVNAQFSALWADKPVDYSAVRCPAVAIYAETMYDLHTKDLQLRESARAWEQKYWVPFQRKSIDRARKELSNVQIVRIPGAHVNFLVMQRSSVIEAMRPFLSGQKSSDKP